MQLNGELGRDPQGDIVAFSGRQQFKVSLFPMSLEQTTQGIGLKAL